MTSENTGTKTTENTSEIVGLKCYPCSLDEVQTDVHSFCVQCVEYLCTNCAKDHRKSKLSRKHVLLEGEAMPTDISTFEEMARLTFCDKHAGREIEFKCDSHNEFICSLCLREKHRACDNVVSVNDNVPDKDTLKGSYFEKHLALKSSLDKQLKVFEDICTQNSPTKILSQIQSLSIDLQKTVIQLDAGNLKAEIDMVNENKSKLDRILRKLNSNLKLVDAVVKHGTDAQLAILYHSPISSTDAIEQGIESPKEFALPMTTQITKGVEDLKDNVSRLKTDLSSFKCLNLGSSELEVDSVKLKTTILSDDNNTDKINLEDKDQNPTNTCELTRPKDGLLQEVKACNVEDVDISSESAQLSLFDRPIVKSKSYDISVSKLSANLSTNIAAVALDNGYMLFADHSNKVVKLTSDEFGVLSYIAFENNPCDLTLIADNLMIVASGKAIFTFSFCCSCREIRRIREFKTKEQIWSITPIDNELAILIPESTDDDGTLTNAFIQVRSMENKILENIYYFGDATSRQVCLNAPFTIRKTKRDDIIIAEAEKVSIFERHGKMKQCFEPGYFTRIAFLAYDTEDNIYVCDRDADKLYQISADFSRCRILISDLRAPYCCVFNPVKKTLVVGCSNDNQVHTYEFS